MIAVVFTEAAICIKIVNGRACEEKPDLVDLQRGPRNSGGAVMKTAAYRAGFTLVASIVAALTLLPAQVAAETAAMPSIDLPNPYAAGVKFGQLPEGRQWGGVITVTPDRDGTSIWASSDAAGTASLPIYRRCSNPSETHTEFG